MFPVRNFIVFGLVAAGTAGCIDLAQADTVNLVGGWNVNWNVQSYPTESPSVAIQIENAAVSSDQIFNSYDLGLKFQLVSGSGQVAVASAANPSTNSVVPAWLESAPRSGLNSGTMVLDNNSSDLLDYAIPDVPTDLLTVDFGPGAIAPAPGSVFDVWSDCTWSDYADHLGNSALYANNQGSDFLLGTITVVPEPGSLVLLAAAAIGIAIGYARRKVGLLGPATT